VTIVSCIFAFAPTSRPVFKVVFNSLKPWRLWDKVASSDYCFGGFEALSEPLRRVDWPPCFKPVTPARFNRSSDPIEFLKQYAVAIRSAGGDGRVMANWFSMATKDEPRWWLLGLPLGSISSWRDLCERFLDKYAPLGPALKGA
jgi:hypothetical protein